MAAARGARSLLSRLIAALCPRTWSSRLCSGTRKTFLQALLKSIAANSLRPTAGHCFSAKLVNCRDPYKKKLLHALQKGEVEAVGGRKSVKVDVRIISATNRDLIVDAKSGRFREDLFYRLHVCLLSVPPLRARREDIPELARHFLTRIAAEEGKRVRSISTEAQVLLAANHWPGNVRQLENAIFRAVVFADGDVIGAGEFR